MNQAKNSTTSKPREGLFAGLEQHPAVARNEPAVAAETFAEQLPRLRKKYPIPLSPHINSTDPHAALLLRSNYEGHCLCKTITAETDKDGAVIVAGADHLKFFSAGVVYARDLAALAQIVLPALNRPDAFVVMAGLKEGVDSRRFRKIVVPDPTDAEFGDPPLIDVPRCFGRSTSRASTRRRSLTCAACADYARELLPAQFHRAQCLASATAKHGLHGREMRLRMWFFFTRPITARSS